MAFLGIIALLGIAFLLSENRKAIRLRTVSMAFLVQVSFAALVLYFDAGKSALESVSSVVQNVISYSTDGIAFLFGNLALAQNQTGFIFAFQVLPVIIFFSSLMSVLYYLGIMQFIVRIIGEGIKRLMGTGHAESMSATANIFVGQTEAPLAVKPYLMGLTRSELFAVMVGGMASIAGSIMAGLAGLGIELKYLIAASFMAAPGGLLMAKMIMPETETPKDQDEYEIDVKKEHTNVIDAAAAGASNGLMLAVNVGAMLIAFIALIALINGSIQGLGAIFGFGVCIIVFGLSTSFWISVVALFFSGVTDGVSMVIRQTILQLKTPDHMRGRVASVNSMFVGSSNELGGFESGVTAKLMGTVTAVVFGGTMTLITVITTAVVSPTFRKLDLRQDFENNDKD